MTRRITLFLLFTFFYTSAWATSGVPNCAGFPTIAACEASYQASFVLLHGATCPSGGGHDDSGGFSSAISAANSGGWKRIVVPGQPYNCLILTQQEDPANGFVIEGPDQNVAYNGDTENAGVIHLNSGFTGGWTSANNCGFDQNGFADFTFHNINFIGDGGSLGTTAICNSFNTTNAMEPQPRLNLENVSASQLGALCCASLTKTGVTGLAIPFSGTGGTGSNLITIKSAGYLRANEGAVALDGNISDAQLTDSTEFASNNCGHIVGVNSGAVNLRLHGRFENIPSSGISGMCGGNAPDIEVTGPGWTMEGQVINNPGVALYFDKAYSDFTFHGILSGNGGAGVSGAESDILFNGDSSAHQNVNLFGIFGQKGIAPPHYFAEWLGTHDSYGINVFGGLGAIAYDTLRDINTGESPVYTSIIAQGEAPVVNPGTKFTTSGGGCTVTSTTGGATAGSFVTSTTGTCTTTITMNGAVGLKAPNGWACTTEDLTTIPVLFTGLMRQTGGSATTAIFSGTTAASDVIIFSCQLY